MFAGYSIHRYMHLYFFAEWDTGLGDGEQIVVTCIPSFNQSIFCADILWSLIAHNAAEPKYDQITLPYRTIKHNMGCQN